MILEQLWYGLVMDQKGVTRSALGQPISLKILGAFEGKDWERHNVVGHPLHMVRDHSVDLGQRAIRV